MRVLLRLMVSLSILIVLTAPSIYADQSKEDAAVEYALNWLDIIDSGEYEQSWTLAASIFRNAVTKEQWVASMLAFRKPLGEVVKRKLKNRHYATSLPGAADGEYVVIQFETRFENKKASTETVTPMLDRDGKWRVSGYYIK